MVSFMQALLPGIIPRTAFVGHAEYRAQQGYGLIDQIIFESKLNPPNCERMQQRQRLLEQASRDGSARLTAIIADAGYGKTVLLAQIMEKTSGPCVWYQFDKSDADVSMFIMHLIEGMRRQRAGFGTWTLRQLGAIPGKSPGAESMIEAFINEYQQTITRPFTFFLDDLHAIKRNRASMKAVSVLLEKMPKNARFFISARERPELPLSRLRTSGALIEMTADDLQFTLDESSRLLSGTKRKRTDVKTLERIYKTVEGWPAGLALIRNQIGKARGETPLAEMTEFGDIDEYIREEVWAGLTSGLRRFLAETSLLRVVNAELFDSIAVSSVDSVDEALAYLEDAARQNILVFQIGDGHKYRVHNLFRDFLQRQLRRDRSRKDIRQLHAAYAEAYEARDNMARAVDQYIGADMTDEVARTVEEFGENALDAGMLRSMKRWLDTLPVAVVEARPWLCYFKLRVTGRSDADIEQTAKWLSKARDGFAAANDRRGMYLCALTNVENYIVKDQYEECIAAAREALALMDKASEKVYALSRIALACQLLGRTSEALDYYTKARSFCTGDMKAEKLRTDASLLGLKFYAGDFLSSREMSQRLYGAVRPDTNSETRFIIFCWRFMALFETGEYEAAQGLVDEAGTFISDEYQGREPIFNIMVGIAMLYTGESRRGRKLIAETVENNSKQYLLGPEPPLNHIGNFERQRRAFSRALELHVASLDINKGRRKYDEASCLVKVGADKLRLAGGDSDDGEAELAQAEVLALEIGAKYILAQVQFHRAWLALQEGDEVKALAYARESLRPAARYGYNRFVSQEGMISLKLLAFAYGNGVEREYLQEIYESIGSKALASLAPLLKSDDAETRKATVQALSRAGGMSAVPRIQRMLRDSDAGVSRAAREALDAAKEISDDPEDLLSRRELEVLELIAEGASNTKIAEMLVIAEPTVKSHVSSIFRKLSVNSRVMAATYYNQRRMQKAAGDEGA